MSPLLTYGALFLLACYACCLSQVAIHNCVHRTFTGNKRGDRAIGLVLASIQLTHFDGWKAAHLLHHRFTNTDKDPHGVDRPLLPYLLSHYWRITRAVWNPKQHVMALLPPLLASAAVVGWQAWAGQPLRGLLWVSLGWLVPVVVGHLWVAHFNYATHVGLPTKRGQNTRDLTGGLWSLVNLMTFNFYHHKQHHLRPSERIPRLPTEAP